MFPLFTLLLFFLLTTPALSRSRHVITISSLDLQPSSLAWDPTLQHFLIGSLQHPHISSVSDAGVIQTLISTIPTSSSVSALVVDDHRRRIIAASSSPSTISSFDLRYPAPHPQIFSSAVPSLSPSAGVAVDLATGTAFVTAADQILAVDLHGNISVLAHVSGADLGGLAHVSRGFLLVLERSKGEMLKVDDEDGTVRRVTMQSSSVDMRAAETLVVRGDGAAVMAGGAVARWLTSKDGWSECVVFDEFRVKEEDRIGGVAVRERRSFYVLVTEETGRSRIEEVDWEREGEGEMVWLMVLLGFGMAYFMYWRFQMGKLVTSISKKRE